MERLALFTLVAKLLGMGSNDGSLPPRCTGAFTPGPAHFKLISNIWSCYAQPKTKQLKVV